MTTKKTAPRKGSVNPPKYAKEGPAKTLEEVQHLTGKALNKMTAEEVGEWYRSTARLANRRFKRLESSGLHSYSQFYQNWIKEGHKTHWAKETIEKDDKGKIIKRTKLTRNEMIAEILQMKQALKPDLKTATPGGTKKAKMDIEKLVGKRTPEEMKRFWEAYRAYEKYEEVQAQDEGSPVVIAAFASVIDEDINKAIDEKYTHHYVGPYDFYTLNSDPDGQVIPSSDVREDARRRLVWARVEWWASQYDDDMKATQKRAEKLRQGKWASADYADFKDAFADELDIPY